MITPLGVGKRIVTSGGDSDDGWWNLSGLISSADVVAAWRAKGADSYAASKVNLANPGTYDADDEGTHAPVWNNIDGWVGDNSAYLKTGIVATSGVWTMIIKYTNADDGKYPIGDYLGWLWWPNNGGSANRIYINDTLTYTSGAKISGVFCLSGNKYYFDGSYIKDCGGTQSQTRDVYLLAAAQSVDSARGEFGGEIQAVAIYNRTLIADEVSALTATMKLL